MGDYIVGALLGSLVTGFLLNLLWPGLFNRMVDLQKKTANHNSDMFEGYVNLAEKHVPAMTADVRKRHPELFKRQDHDAD